MGKFGFSWIKKTKNKKQVGVGTAINQKTKPMSDNLPGKLPPLARAPPRTGCRAAPRAPGAPPRPALLATPPRAGGPPARPRATTPRPRPGGCITSNQNIHFIFRKFLKTLNNNKNNNNN